MTGSLRSYRGLAASIGYGVPFYYAIEARTESAWEEGVGTITEGTAGAPDYLTRSRVIASSNSGSAVSFAAGVKHIYGVFPSVVCNNADRLKGSCRVASSTNVTVATALENGDTLDGVTLATGDRVLLYGQSTASQNGVWVVAASGTATRPSDFYTGDGASGAVVPVRAGTDAGKVFVCTTAAGSDVIGTGSLTFTTTSGTPADGSITNAKLADMAQATLKGRAAGAGTGAPVDLTATQATEILNAFVGDSGSGGTKGLVPAPAAGDAAAGKYLDADGTWTIPAGGGGSGDVTAASNFGTDNVLIRSDGTSKGVQSTGITVADNNRISLVSAAIPYSTLTDGSTVTIDWALSNNFKWTIAAAGRTLAFSNATPGQTITVEILQGGSGSNTITTYPSGITYFPNGTAPTLATAVSALDILVIRCTGSGTYNLLHLTAAIPTKMVKDFPAQSWIPAATNGPDFAVVQNRPCLLFDASTVETAYSPAFRWSATGTVVVDIFYAAASATSGKFDWDVYVEAITAADAVDMDAAESWDAANSGDQTVPGTAGYLGVVTITLTNKDSAAVGDYCRLRLERDADDGTNDTATGDARVWAVTIRET